MYRVDLRLASCCLGGNPLDLVTQSAAVGLAALFAAACLGKVDSYDAWAITVSRLFPLGRRSNPVVRLGVPAVEGALAVGILIAPRIGLAVGSVFLVTLGAFVLVVNGGRSGMTCNCFGAIMPSKIGTSLAIRNFALAFAAAGVSYASFTSGLDSISPQVAVGGGWAGLLIVALAELRRIRRRWAETGWRSPART
jgi:hypothetical protein